MAWCRIFSGSMGTLAVYGGLSRDVADSALLLNVLTRPDARDSFAVPYRGIDYLDGLDGGVAGLRIAWSPDPRLPGRIPPSSPACSRPSTRW